MTIRSRGVALTGILAFGFPTTSVAQTCTAPNGSMSSYNGYDFVNLVPQGWGSSIGTFTNAVQSAIAQ